MDDFSNNFKLLPYQKIKQLAAQGQILGSDGSEPIPEGQFGSCSLDLRLGKVAHRIRASFLGGSHSKWKTQLKHFSTHKMNLTGQGTVLEKDCVYLIPIQEELRLSANLCGRANTRSTAGRLGIFTRLVVVYDPKKSRGGKNEPATPERIVSFDEVPPGHHGRLYLEVCPTCFSIRVKQGDSLNHLRFYEERDPNQLKPHIEPTLLRFDLAATNGNPVAYLAKPHTDLIDFSAVSKYEPSSFWQPVFAEEQGIILNPGDFYILRTKNKVVLKSNQAGYLRSYHAEFGEFRLHYAAFLDAGFGAHSASGSSIVLEVKGREVPFFLEDGQITGYLQCEELTEATSKPYGYDNQQAYRNEGLQLARQFKPWKT